MKPLQNLTLGAVFLAASVMPNIFGNQTFAQTSTQDNDPIAMTVSNDNGDPDKTLTTAQRAKNHVKDTHGMAVTIQCAPAGAATAKQVADFLEKQYDEINLKCFIEATPDMNGKAENVSFYTLRTGDEGQPVLNTETGYTYSLASELVTSAARMHNSTLEFRRKYGEILDKQAIPTKSF